jgi:hypothetical protein
MIHRGGNRISQVSPVDALRYNAHPELLLREVPEEAWGRTLRAIDREASRWAAQRTPHQTEWLEDQRRAGFRGTLAAAREIVSAGFLAAGRAGD